MIYNLVFLEDQNFLSHYGVKGMKWGVRHDNRNKASSNKKQKEKNIKKQIRAVKKSRRAASKKRVLLSDEELNKRIDRLEREKRLKELTDSEISPGRKAVKNQLVKVGNTLLSSIAKQGSNLAVKKLLGKV